MEWEYAVIVRERSRQIGRMIRILKETENYIAVRKPAGMATQSGKLGQMDLVNQVLNELAARQRRERRLQGKTGLPEAPYLAVINRLDQPVEGIVLFAKNPKAAAKLSEMLRNHEIRKEYLAVVCLIEKKGPSGNDIKMTGRIEPDAGNEMTGRIEPGDGIEMTGRIEPGNEMEMARDMNPEDGKWHELSDFMARDGRGNTSRIVHEGTPGAQKAILQYRMLKMSGAEQTGMKRALLLVDLDTGRHHQIRLQLSHAGMPIVGDRKDGIESGRGTDFAEKRRGEHGDFPALCAFRLIFTDPWSRERVEIRNLPEGKNFASIGEIRMAEI